MKTVFIHPERCVGCKQCELACAVAHSRSKNLFLAVGENPAPRARIHAEAGLALNTSFPNTCRHCNPAPCQAICPSGAISRAADHPDTVQINPHKCIACGMCALVCPFDVITYHAAAAAPERAAVATKCDHCLDRLQAGQIPACVEACKAGALLFGEINDLVKAARSRYAEAVSVATGQPGNEIVALPAHIVAWRNWGAAIHHLNRHAEKGA
jgi:carbon-monoxide dehydrogenase iron sulfur subunit